MGQRTYSDVQPDGALLAWEVERLWQITKDFPVKRVLIDTITEFDLVCWFDGEKYKATCRAVTEHVRKILDSQFTYPVILSAQGHVMDGMHRVAKAHLLGHEYIDVVQFEQDPEPDETIYPAM